MKFTYTKSLTVGYIMVLIFAAFGGALVANNDKAMQPVSAVFGCIMLAMCYVLLRAWLQDTVEEGGISFSGEDYLRKRVGAEHSKAIQELINQYFEDLKHKDNV